MTVAIAFILALICWGVSLIFTSKLTNSLKENGHQKEGIFHSFNLFKFIRFIRREDDPSLKRKYIALYSPEVALGLLGIFCLISDEMVNET